MKSFFLRHKKLHIWLLAELVLLGLFFLARGKRSWMNALTGRITTPLKEALGQLCRRVPFSVAELLCVLLILGAALYLIGSVLAAVRSKTRLRRAYSAVLGLACMALSVYAGFCLLWGVNYCTDSFQERSGIYARDVSTEELLAVTQYFADRLTACADDVPRDETGRFAVSREEILADAPHVYDALEAQFPFLEFDDIGVKPVRFSRVMSALDFTGVYCPYTGEANVNMDAPACLLPATAAHEMAHQRAIASEQECNFLAILAGTTCANPAYVYSAWLLGLIHLGNALQAADADAFRTVYASLPDTVRADLAENNAYWDAYRGGAARKVSNRVYENFLKSYGETRGLQSYGTVVDLLVVYYAEAAGAAA